MKRIGLVSVAALVAVACQGDRTLVPPSRGPSALIQDARHNGGNEHFFFLPPMVSQPSFSGVFNPNLSPTVEIRRLADNSCAPGPVRTFSGSQVEVSLTDAQYHVNWQTDVDELDPACTYRIRVLVGSTELGIADVDVVSTAKELKNVQTGLYIPLLDDRTLPIKFRIEGGALCGAGADCGEGTARPAENTTIVTQNLQAGVFIPAGAVGEAVTIIVESVDDRPCFPGLYGHSFQGTPGAEGNSCYLFRTDPPLPDGKFNAGFLATVGICVDLSGVTETEEPKIQIFQFDDGEVPTIRPLPNVPAPFLPCDPSYPGIIGAAKRGLLDLAARSFGSLLSPLAALVAPRPLFASTNMVTFDLGAGGSTDGFSTFTWGLVTDMAKQDGDGQSAIVGNAVAVHPSVVFHDSTGDSVSGVPVTFAVVGGGGSIVGTASATSDVHGVAALPGDWVLGPSAGTNTLEARAPLFSGVTPATVTFTATGVAGTIFRATFTNDAVNTPPGAPEIGTWSFTNPAGTILVRSAVGDLTNQPVELDHFIAGASGSLNLRGTVAGTPPTTGTYMARWRSLVHSADACFNAIVLRDANSLILASVEYRPGGQLTYDSNSLNATAGSWTQDVSQLFEITLDLDAKVSSLSIDGTPVSTLQGVSFVQSGAADLSQINMELGCVAPPAQTYAWDDIEIVLVP